MLALVRSKGALSNLRHARPLCAAADPDKIIRDIEASIELAKKLIANPPKNDSYSEAEVTADIAKGAVNSLKLGDVFSGDDELKKDMVKMAGQLNTTKAAIASQKLPEVNWDKYDRVFNENGMDPGLVDALKKTFLQEEKNFMSSLEKAKQADLAKGTADINALFDGANGITAQFKSVDDKLNADRVGYLAELEGLLHESANVDTLTIAEILEKNPEWQAAIEEDIKNHNWGSEPPASLVQKNQDAAKE